MKYKWKDKVRIKSKKELECISEVTDDMLKNGGTIMTIACLVEDADGYIMKEDGDFHFLWSDDMIEGLVEEEVDLIPKFGEFSDNEPLNVPKMTTEFIKEIGGLPCPEGYIFKDENGNVINATKIILEKKKKEYPKTYEECYKVLGIEGRSLLINTEHITDYEIDLAGQIGKLHKLIICRDAYWKIAGDWRPEFRFGKKKYSIMTKDNKVISATVEETNRVLVFPTEEMRDAFKENFDKDLETCKELL